MERDGPEDQGEIDRCIARHMASHGDANSKRKAFNLLQQSGAAKPSHLRAFLGEAWCWKALPAQVCTDWVVTNSSNRFGESHGRGGSASCSDNLSRFTELVHAAATDDDDDDDDDDNHDDDDDDDYDDDDDNHDDDVPGGHQFCCCRRSAAELPWTRERHATLRLPIWVRQALDRHKRLLSNSGFKSHLIKRI